jgi:hypothetical protein
MKLIPRRKQQPTTFERVASYVKLGAKGLAAQRVARRTFRTYKFTRRALPLAGLAAIGAVVAKRFGGGGGETAPSGPPAPSATPAPSTPPPSAASGASDTPPPGDASRTEESLDIDGPNQSTPPPPESTPAQ